MLEDRNIGVVRRYLPYFGQDRNGVHLAPCRVSTNAGGLMDVPLVAYGLRLTYRKGRGALKRQPTSSLRL